MLSDLSNRDINPYWQYICADSPCEICEPLDGMIFKYDEASDDLWPPQHFNCYCTTEPTDDAGDDEKDLASDEDIQDGIERTPEQFRDRKAGSGSSNQLLRIIVRINYIHHICFIGSLKIKDIRLLKDRRYL